MTTTDAIRAANAHQARRRRRLIAYGQWQPFVDAQPARDHVNACRASGMSLTGISKYTGVNIGTLNHLLYGKGPYPPAKKIRPESAEALLAYWPCLNDYNDGAIIDGTGTRRRMQALAALGFPSATVHQHVTHITLKAVERLRFAERVTARTARSVRDFYNTASGRMAEELGVTPWVARRTRTYATKWNYAPPVAWDPETIDNPAAIPDLTGHCGTDRGWWLHRLEAIPVCPPCETAHAQWKAERAHLTREERWSEIGKARKDARTREADLAHDARELIRISGADIEQAADRLRVTKQHLQQALKRHPEPAQQDMEQAA